MFTEEKGGSSTSSQGEIGSNVISEKSLPFERQTQYGIAAQGDPSLIFSVHFSSPPCLPIGPANGNKSLSQITISSLGT